MLYWIKEYKSILPINSDDKLDKYFRMIVYFQHDGGLPIFLYEFHSLLDDEKEFSPDALDLLLKEFEDVIYESEEDNENGNENYRGDKDISGKMENSVNMTKFYGYAGHQMRKMLLKCSWRRKPCSAANFTATFTDAGKF